jgi:hypothetical protein
MKKICFIYTAINGEPNNNENVVMQKNLYDFDRMIAIHYSIGTYDTKYNEIKRIKHIVKPDTMYFKEILFENQKITYMDALKGTINSVMLQQLKDNLKDVDCIVSNSQQIKSIQVECFRTTISIDFTKYTIIDMNEYKLKKKIVTLDNIIQEFFIKYESK